MCNDNKKSNCPAFVAVLENILRLQQKTNDTDYDGCSKPFLYDNCALYNTRPLCMYTCCNNAQITMPFTMNESIQCSNVFRIENLNDCCCVCRILGTCEDGSYYGTNEFFTVNLNCIGAIKCLQDTFVANI